MMAEWLAFATVMVIGQFSPGPDMLLLTRTSLVEGLKAGWLMVLGIVSGLLLHATLAIGGIVAVIGQGGVFAVGMRWLAAGYLVWLAWGLFQKDEGTEEVVISKRSPYLRGLFCNLLNPKVMVFLATVTAPFLNGSHPTWWPYVLWLTILAEGLFFWGMWVWLLQMKKVRTAYQKAGRTLDLLFALTLLGLAVSLLWSF